MTEIILHHYPASPFAEKIRAILGAKQLTWKSVIIPRIMPKPDVVALTGGYRKTPILQLGADIICDTALIARKLNQLAPSPDLYPAHAALSAEALAAWADSILFQAAVPVAFQPAVMTEVFAGNEEQMQAFLADRAAMRKGSATPRLPLAEAKNSFMLYLGNLEQELADKPAFLLGEQPTIADFSLYHPLWFVATKPIVSELFKDYPNIRRWMDTMAGLGNGSHTEISSGEAIAIAHKAHMEIEEHSSTLDDLPPGTPIVVQPTDYGMDPVQGTLLYCDAHEVALQRQDDRAGEVAVHFPRINFSIRKVE